MARKLVVIAMTFVQIAVPAMVPEFPSTLCWKQGHGSRRPINKSPSSLLSFVRKDGLWGPGWCTGTGSKSQAREYSALQYQKRRCECG